MMKTIIKYQLIPFMVFSFFVMTSCEDFWNDDVEGNGDMTFETRTLDSFSRVVINGDFEVRIDTGSVYQAVVKTDENLIDLIVTHVSDNKLIIEVRDGVNIDPTERVEINVTMQSVREINLNGSGLVYGFGIEGSNILINLSGSGRMEFSEMVADASAINLNGSGEIICESYCGDMVAQIAGSGEIRLNGECESADFKILGSGRIKAPQNYTSDCTVYISGSGIADVIAYESLAVKIIGSGMVYYSGNPSVTDFYVSGSGQIIKR